MLTAKCTNLNVHKNAFLSKTMKNGIHWKNNYPTVVKCIKNSIYTKVPL